jgi:hypothetical protein
MPRCASAGLICLLGENSGRRQPKGNSWPSLSCFNGFGLRGSGGRSHPRPAFLPDKWDQPVADLFRVGFVAFQFPFQKSLLQYAPHCQHRDFDNDWLIFKRCASGARPSRSTPTFLLMLINPSRTGMAAFRLAVYGEGIRENTDHKIGCSTAPNRNRDNLMVYRERSRLDSHVSLCGSSIGV